jgi:hypothetical protein
MKRFAAMMTVLATPALAHDGVHLHPHGIDAVWLVLAALALGGGAAALLRIRK